MKETMTVREAAEIFGMSDQAVRLRMRKGDLKIGRVWGSGSKKTYIIYKSLVEKEIGK